MWLMALQQNNKCEFKLLIYCDWWYINLYNLYSKICNIPHIYYSKKNPKTLPLKSKRFSYQPYPFICTQTLHVHDLGRCTILIFYQT